MFEDKTILFEDKGVLLADKTSLFEDKGALITAGRALFADKGALLTAGRALFADKGALLAAGRALFADKGALLADKISPRITATERERGHPRKSRRPSQPIRKALSAARKQIKLPHEILETGV